MKVVLGNVKGVETFSFQAKFPRQVTCVKCNMRADLAFVAHEQDEPVVSKGGKYVQGVKQHAGKDKLWVHDACCVAVYFCRSCLAPTAVMNQA